MRIPHFAGWYTITQSNQETAAAAVNAALNDGLNPVFHHKKIIEDGDISSEQKIKFYISPDKVAEVDAALEQAGVPVLDYTA